jgi:FKBP-type peptidyl-prolyl cis-trans isomerase
MSMKHSLIATSLFALWYGVGAVAAPAEPVAQGAAAVDTGAAAEARPAGAEAQPASEAAAPAGAAVSSKLEIINYSLGYALGENLKREDLKPVPEALLKGVEDAISGAKPQVKGSARFKALREIKEAEAKENLERSQAFLAEVVKQEGIKLLPSGLLYKEIRAGEGKTPEPNSLTTVNYRGSLIDGSVIDSSYDRGEPAKLRVNRLIKGWREGIQLMNEGAKWELYIPPNLAFGKNPRDKRIPPNSALIYEVELLAVEPGPAAPARPERPLPPVRLDTEED